MEVAVTMPSTRTILERLRWKVGLGLVIVAAGFAAGAAPSSDAGSSDVARSSWGLKSQAEAVDVARSSWGFARSSASSRSTSQVEVDAAADAA